MDVKDNNIKRNKIPFTYASVVASKSLLPPSPSLSPHGIADSGASEHYITVKHSPACYNPSPSPSGPIVLTADGTKMKATHSVRIISLLTMRDSLDFSPSQDIGNLKTDDFYATVIDNKPFRRSYSDQTGRFPIQSSCGNNYVFIMYAYDANAIMSVALPDRRGSSTRDAWLKIYKNCNLTAMRQNNIF